MLDVQRRINSGQRQEVDMLKRRLEELGRERES